MKHYNYHDEVERQLIRNIPCIKGKLKKLTPFYVIVFYTTITRSIQKYTFPLKNIRRKSV